MKYIDADRLREELQKPKIELKAGNYYLDNSEQAVGYENALVDFELLIGSLQQEMELPKKYQTPDWIWEGQEQPVINIPSAGSGAMSTTPSKFKPEVKEQPASEGLEEAAEESWVDYEYRERPQGLYSSCYKDGFIAGAEWMKDKMIENAVERVVKVDAGGYPYIDATELYDYENDKPLAKAGDKVRMIVLKAEEE